MRFVMMGLAEGTGGVAPGVAAGPCHLLAACWHGPPGPGRVVSTWRPSAVSATICLADSSVCLKELLQVFSLVALF